MELPPLPVYGVLFHKRNSHHLRVKDRFTLLLGANLMGDCKLKPVLVYHTENLLALKGYDKNSLPIHWYSNSSGWMTGNIFQAHSKTQLFHELKEYCTTQGLPFKILMLLDNAPAHPQWLSDLHSNIKFCLFAAEHQVKSLLQPMYQGMIKMFKAHLLRKSWRSLSLKCPWTSLKRPLQLPKIQWNFRRMWCSSIGSRTPSMMPFGMSLMNGRKWRRPASWVCERSCVHTSLSTSEASTSTRRSQRST